jgi:hypothetical protein
MPLSKTGPCVNLQRAPHPRYAVGHLSSDRHKPPSNRQVHTLLSIWLDYGPAGLLQLPQLRQALIWRKGPRCLVARLQVRAQRAIEEDGDVGARQHTLPQAQLRNTSIPVPNLVAAWTEPADGA